MSITIQKFNINLVLIYKLYVIWLYNIYQFLFLISSWQVLKAAA